MREERVVVVGPGAIGLLAAASMCAAGHAVTLVGWSRDGLDDLRRSGIRVRAPGLDVHHEVDVLDVADVADVAGARTWFLAVKSQGTAGAMTAIAPHLADDAHVVSLQNGLNEYTIADHVGRRRVVAAVVSLAARREASQGVSMASVPGAVTVGQLAGEDAAPAHRVAALLASSLCDVQVAANIENVLWSKLVLNALVNTLGVVGGTSIGDTLGVPGVPWVAQQVVREGRDVARARGQDVVRLPNIDLPLIASASDTAADEELARYAATRRDAVASSLQDLHSGRSTELPFLSGELLRHAADLRVEVPCLRAVHEAARGVEAGTTPSSPRTLRQLAAACLPAVTAVPHDGGAR